MLTSKFLRRKLIKNLQNPQRFQSNIQPLTPVKLSYATYENASDNPSEQSPPLLIMHGLFGSKSNWQGLCKMIQQKTTPPRKIIAVDARNHGESPHDPHHSYAHLAEDIKGFLDSSSIPSVALLGHSMGGRAVMLFALKYPELVEKLLVADISPTSNSASLKETPNVFRLLEQVQMPRDGSIIKARASVDEQLSRSMADKSVRSFLITNLVQSGDGGYKWRINLEALVDNFQHIVQFPTVSDDMVYEGPTRFIAGELSDYVPFHDKRQNNSIMCQSSLARLHHNILKLSRGYSYQRPTNIQPPPQSTDDKSVLRLAYATYESTASTSILDPHPLLVHHGLFGSKNNWNSLCKIFHEKSCKSRPRKILAIDARNHGDSPHAQSITYDNLVMDMREFLEQMTVKKVCLLGHSFGGRACMLFALKYPDLVHKLIVVDISPITTSVTFKAMPQLFKMLSVMPLPQKVPLGVARQLLSRHLSTIFGYNKPIVALLLTNLVQFSDGRIGWRMNVEALRHNFDQLGGFPDVHNTIYPGPTLFIGGTNSDFIQKSDLPSIKKLFPQAELVYLKGANHLMHVEKPVEFSRLIVEFLNR